jgi:hypothetical protein
LPLATAQTSTDASTPNPAFRIGFVRQDPEAITTAGVYQRLREFLLAQPDLQNAMKSAGLEEREASSWIILQSFDSHRLLIEAMDAEQVDLAFCSVIDYAYQRGSYEPIFQLRRHGDPHSSTGDRRVWHSGVIFVNNRSPLFTMETSAAVAALPQYIISREMAMVGSSSAAGYVYPYLALDRLTTSVPVINARSVFWESSSEVVKAVLNGMHEVGACDASAVNEVLGAYGLLDQKNKLVKEILRTDPVPRDPIVIHTRWLASSPYSTTPAAAAGRELIRAVSGFFQASPNLPQLERTSREPFLEVSENLQRFRELRQQ